MRKYKNEIIAFFIIGIPFFVECYLAVFPGNNHFEYINKRYFINIGESLLVFFITYVSYYVSHKFRWIVITIWAIFIYIPVALNLICVQVSGFFIYEDFIYAILSTDLKEMLLCIKEYFVFITVNICILLYAYSMKIKKPKNMSCFYTICPIILLIGALIISETLPFFNIVLSVSEYYRSLENEREFCKNYSPLQGIKTINEKQTVVIVIGESVDRKHMGIYGYNAQTTPYFCNLKDELFVFKNATAVYVFTDTAVKSILKLYSIGEKSYTIIHFFNDAGFKTFWFSNQGKCHAFDNYGQMIGKLCSEYAFINNEIKLDSSSFFDSELLKYLQYALKDKAQKKLIILHLMGSHVPVDIRYPPEFNKFILPKNYHNMEKASAVCHYDNSILYTDYVLNDIIKILKQQNDCSCMLYLADHGMNVYDNEKCEVFERTAPHAYEIPFIIWLSPKYKNANKDFIKHWDMNVPYKTNQTAYTIIDLARMHHPSIDLSKSIFYRKL